MPPPPSPQSPTTTLTLPTRLLLTLGPPSTLLLTYLASPKTALLSPLAVLPSALFFTKYRSLKKTDPTSRGEEEPLIWIYALTGTVGLALAGVAQAGICGAASVVLFPDGERRGFFWEEFQRSSVTGLAGGELARRVALAGTWQNWVFNGVLAFVAAGLVEETLKYLPIVYARRRNRDQAKLQLQDTEKDEGGNENENDRRPKGLVRNRAYIDYALTGALSFGVIENLGFIYAACAGDSQSWPKLLLTLFERVILGSSAHLLAAALTASRATKRDFYPSIKEDGEKGNGKGKGKWEWLGVIWPAAVLHGVYNFGALGFSAWEGNVGWVHPEKRGNTVMMLGLAFGVVGGTAWLVGREWGMIRKVEKRRD